MECEGMTSVGFYSSGLQSASFLLLFGFLHHSLCKWPKKTHRPDSHVVKTEKSSQKILMAIAIIVQEPLGNLTKGVQSLVWQ
jgi:hypothetical protein